MRLVRIRYLATVSGVAFAIGIVLSSATAFAEICGIDSIFADGYEVAGFVPIAQIAGGSQSPGLIPNIIGSGTLSVTVTSPGTGATTRESTVDVLGTFVGPVNTGIAVNNASGYVVNGHFLVPNVGLASGANSLAVQATTLPAATASTSAAITQSGSAPLLAITASRVFGYAPIPIAFSYALGTLPGAATVQSVAIDFNGDGTDEYTGSSFTGAPTSFTYMQPGIYTVRVRVTDTSSATYTAYRSVAVQDVAVQRGMMCDIYGYVKDRLNAQDATGAGNAYQPVVRSDFTTFFTQLGTNMPATAQQLGTILDGQLGTGFADLLLVRDNPDQTRSGFPMRLTQGSDGVWRISEM